MKVHIVIGSKSDEHVANKVEAVLTEFGVKYSLSVASAHRTPDKVKRIAESEADIFIAIAGLSAALPGTIAAHAIKPVIGVPVSGKVNLDSILSIVQMPPGIPVAAVGLDRGDNAALLAIEVLAIHDKKLQQKLEEHRKKMRERYV